MFKRLCVIAAFIMIHGLSCGAQTHQQVWLDYQVDYPFANKYLLEAVASYQTVLTNDYKWRSASLTPTFEYVAFTNLDLTVDLPVGYTVQKEGSNSFEMAPMIGTRFHISQNKRINARILLRYQNRYFYEIENEKWDIVNRVRLKGEVSIAINGPNLFQDKLWYTFMDYEEFFVIDKQVNERYANRRRGRLGLGYRLSYQNRFEMSYTLQSSRNEIEGDFISMDNVLQLVYKMYLNPPKKTDSK